MENRAHNRKTNDLPSNGQNQLVFPESGGPTRHNLGSFIGNCPCRSNW